MKRLLLLAVLLSAAQAARAQTAHSQYRSHPAVVRITALERGGASLGSGALVEVNQTHGLVVTNWHVVRDANGQQLAYAYHEEEPGRRSVAKLLSKDETQKIASKIAKKS